MLVRCLPWWSRFSWKSSCQGGQTARDRLMDLQDQPQQRRKKLSLQFQHQLIGIQSFQHLMKQFPSIPGHSKIFEQKSHVLFILLSVCSVERINCSKFLQHLLSALWHLSCKQADTVVCRVNGSFFVLHWLLIFVETVESSVKYHQHDLTWKLFFNLHLYTQQFVNYSKNIRSIAMYDISI